MLGDGKVRGGVIAGILQGLLIPRNVPVTSLKEATIRFGHFRQVGLVSDDALFTDGLLDPLAHIATW